MSTRTRLTAADIHPDLRLPLRFLRRLPSSPALMRPAQWLVTRQVPPRMPDATGYRFARLGPGAAVHVYEPAPGRATGGALLWIHGGGYITGAARMDQDLCIRLARDEGLVVVSADYRLASDQPYPAALDDVHLAWSWLQAHAEALGVDPTRTAIGGQSAGGGLTAALVQRVHDDAGVRPAAQWLFCPMLDDRTAADTGLDAVGHFVWDNRLNRLGWGRYLGTPAGHPGPPPGRYAVPARREDLTGLPPAWIGVGDIDLFHDEDLRYAQALRAAGVPVTLDVVRGAPHGFESLRPGAAVSRQYLERATAWLRERLGPDGG